MKNKLLISAAAIALIAGGGIASAQKQDAPVAKPAAPHAAPKAAAAPKAEMQKVAPRADIKSQMKGTTGQASRAEKISPRAEHKGAKGAETTGQAPAKNEMQKNEMKGDAKPHMKARPDFKADRQTGTRTKSGMKAGNDNKPQTTGQGASGARSANLTSEQRTRIRSSIKRVSVRPVKNVNFSISIGARVPRSVHLYRLPVQVVEYYPSWRGYEFILVGDEILVINPRTFEIVAVLEA